MLRYHRDRERQYHYEVSLGCILIGIVGVFFNLETWFRNARAVGEGQVATSIAGFGRNNFDFSFAPHAVIIEGVLAFAGH